MELYKIILLNAVVVAVYGKRENKRIHEKFDSNGDSDLKNFIEEFDTHDEDEDEDEEDFENIVSGWDDEPIDINLLQMNEDGDKISIANKNKIRGKRGRFNSSRKKNNGLRLGNEGKRGI